MADGGDEVGFHVVEQAKTGHILKHDGRSEKPVGFVAHPDDARQEKFFLIIDSDHDRLLEAFGEIVRRALEQFLDLRQHR